MLFSLADQRSAAHTRVVALWNPFNLLVLAAKAPDKGPGQHVQKENQPIPKF